MPVLRSIALSALLLACGTGCSRESPVLADAGGYTLRLRAGGLAFSLMHSGSEIAGTNEPPVLTLPDREIRPVRLISRSSGPGWSELVYGSASGEPQLRARFEASEPAVLRVSYESLDPAAIGLREELMDPGGRFYGLLEHPGGKRLVNNGAALDYAPTRGPDYANARAPFVLSDRFYAIYAPTEAIGRFVFQTGRLSIGLRDRKLSYFIAAHGDYARIYEWYKRVAGVARVPPGWALGPLWWRDDPLSSDGVAHPLIGDVVALERARLHASAFWLDRPYGSGERGWGNLDLDARLIEPEVGALLSSRGLHVLLWVANRASGSLYQDALARGFLPSPAPPEKDWPAANLASAEARAWMQDVLRRLGAMGARGFKIDRGDESEMPSQAVNAHAALLPELASAALRELYGEDHFVFARNIADGARRFAGVWSGDPEASFEGLRLAVRHALRSALIGFPMWGSDTGGYRGSADKELHARWLQFSAFSPMMEILIDHGTDIWARFDAEHLEIMRRYARLHHELRPHLLAELQSSADTGYPLMRPLFLEWPGMGFEDLDSQFMLGRELLVAPVLDAGKIAKLVELPPGDWLRLDVPGQPLRGPARESIPAPLAEIPVLVRAGAVLLRGDTERGNDTWTPQWRPRMDVEIYPAEGQSRALSYPGARGRLPIAARMERGRIAVELPDFGMDTNLILHARRPESVTRGGVKLEAGRDYTIDEERGVIRVPLRGAASVTLRAESLFIAR